ncbi:hypothetical protein POX_c03884 [Penicillium oxalicum]|uniref:Uncharacterized protein n=1 Tax=Penicillium oxalicum (strain 114-2 / CGMCC 5302) TaxID=933388 RepID=S8AUI0_PENO1|nr:hypothetical protein POX_c03884 [Penicillium oxalicum]EPS25502.1 hypothetical protein PDE_00435 [Penicillium oxalicum 114-2]KAI2791029.1 hypothetical protein POX_c03884 [Penicillium oxalicum]
MVLSPGLDSARDCSSAPLLRPPASPSLFFSTLSFASPLSITSPVAGRSLRSYLASLNIFPWNHLDGCLQSDLDSTGHPCPNLGIHNPPLSLFGLIHFLFLVHFGSFHTHFLSPPTVRTSHTHD